MIKKELLQEYLEKERQAVFEYSADYKLKTAKRAVNMSMKKPC